MAKGPYYSNTENERLLKLWEDNKDKTFAEVAEMAIFYGICEGRSPRAVAQQLSKLVNPPEEGPQAELVEMDITSLILEKENKELRNELSSLLETILGTATLYNGYALHLDYREILKWLFANEPEKTAARIETLRLEEVTNA